MNLQPGSRPVPNAPDYFLVRLLGAGAFGEVWQARAPGGIDVALKFIRLGSVAHATSELRSLDAVKRIRHPNLLSLFGAWQKGNWLILAMEMGDCTLHDRLAAARKENLPGIPERELLGYIADAAKGLDTLNAKQVLHRDVKPANLLIVGSGVKVADFGLAKVLERSATTDSSGGTVAYMAPECFRGELAPQSDQYSLAVTYFHLRTGRPLFEGDPARVMYSHLQEAADLSCLPSLEAIVVARAISKDPKSRWLNCREFGDELHRAQRTSHRVDALRCRGVRLFVSELRSTHPHRVDPEEHEQTVNDCTEAIDLLRLELERCENVRDCNRGGIAERGNEPRRRLISDLSMTIWLRGWVWRVSGHPLKAISEFTELVRLNPTASNWLIMRAETWQEMGDQARAISDLDEAVRLHPSDEHPLICRGNARLKMGSYHKAVEDFNRAIELDPSSAGGYGGRARAWAAMGMIEEAIREFDAAIRLDPDDSELRESRRLAFHRLNPLPKPSCH